jgi:NAD+ synthase (glutamine-hydrolysing)
VRVGLAQVNPTVGAVEANARLEIAGMERARALGCDLVAFPELVLTGYPPEDLLFKPAFIEANLRALDEVARQSRGLTAIVGYVDKRDDIFNAAAMLHDGALAGTYHKQYLPNSGVFDENRYFQSGTEAPVFTLGNAVIAANICEDIWYPTGPTTLQALGGAELVVSINASPYHSGKGRFREKMLATRAADDLVCLAFVNAVGGQDELIFDGQSFVVDHDGDVVARSPQFKEDLLIAEVDPQAALSARLRDTRRRPAARNLLQEIPHLGSFTVRDGGRDSPGAPRGEVTPLLDRCDEIYEALVLGTRDYVEKNGFRHVVIGLSGGIDSTLVALIAVDALGPDRVTTVTMPSPYSSSGTRSDAHALAQNLGVELLELSIAPMMESFDVALREPFAGKEPGIAEENLQARIRGNLLMALSNKFGWLVLTTGNKSELAVGYSTLYGDSAGGFAVIKDVPKTLVYELTELRDARAGGGLVPPEIVTRPPSAELRPDQRDEDSLPPYEVLDRILEGCVEHDHGREQLIARGLPEADVDRVIRLVDLAEYKRRQNPPGIKISSKAFGRDRRVPITNRYGG